jgi:hypothetical protein
VLVQTPDGPWRLAINVRSDDESNLLFRIEPDFQHSILVHGFRRDATVDPSSSRSNSGAGRGREM